MWLAERLGNSDDFSGFLGKHPCVFFSQCIKSGGLLLSRCITGLMGKETDVRGTQEFEAKSLSLLKKIKRVKMPKLVSNTTIKILLPLQSII